VDCVVTTLKDSDKELYLIGPVLQEFFQIVDYELFRKDTMELFSDETSTR